MLFLTCAPFAAYLVWNTFHSNGIGLNFFLAAMVLTLVVYAPLYESQRNFRRVTIDSGNSTVMVEEVSMLRRRRVYHYPINAFSAVGTYVGRGQAPVGWVALLEDDLTSGLDVAEFELDRGFEEPAAAAKLRVTLSADLKLHDAGFLGAGMMSPDRAEHLPSGNGR